MSVPRKEPQWSIDQRLGKNKDPKVEGAKVYCINC